MVETSISGILKMRGLNEKRRTSNNKCLDRINYILYPILDSSNKTYMIFNIEIPLKNKTLKKIKRGDSVRSVINLDGIDIRIEIKKGDTESITLSTSPE